MNNKILSVVLVAGIATTGFAGISAANESGVDFFKSEKSEIRELIQKARNGEELSEQELTVLEDAKSFMKEYRGKKSERGFKGHGKRAGFHMLTDDEKAQLESMSSEERREFFEAKKVEMEEKRQAHKSVMDKLIAGEDLTSAEEDTRLEMLAKFTEKSENIKKAAEKRAVIGKLLAGDELTDSDRDIITEMQEKRAEREELKTLKEKLSNGETLSAEEQEKLDNAKEAMKGKRGEYKGMRGYARGHF